MSEIAADEKKIATLLALKEQESITCTIPGLKLPLEGHQSVGVAYAVVAEKSLNLDFLGAGKTVTALATDLKLRSLGKVYRTLVVCQGGKRWDWQKEYKRFTDIPTYVVDGSKTQRVNTWLAAQQDNAVTIVHYEGLRGDLLNTDRIKQGKKEYKIHTPAPLLAMLKFDLIIFDEVTVFKNWNTTLHKALEFLVGNVRHQYTIGLSATVIQKSLADLWSIMDIVRPGLLGVRESFEDEYVIKRQFSTFAGKRKVRYEKIVGFKNEAKLAYIMNPFYIRREKEKVYAGKIKHVAKIRNVELLPAQLKAYRKVTDSVDRGDSRQSLLTRFLEMEKICDTMRWFDGDESAKIDDLMGLLTSELEDEKVVVFSKHHRPLEHLASRLDQQPIPYVVYSGRITDVKEREANRQQFQEDDLTKVCLVTTAAEMGFDFHAAHYLVYLNHVYNPARIDQLRGRIDRPIVQKSSFICTIHYVTRATFEEGVIPRLHREADLMRKVFGAENSFESLLSDTTKDLIVDGLDTEQLYSLIKTGNLGPTQDAFSHK